jgi:carboxylesterase type B
MNRREKYEAYLQSPHWKDLKQRKFFLSPKCVVCGSKDNRRAHHTRYRELLDDCTTDDLLTLCRVCHDTLHVALHHFKQKVGDAPTADDAKRIIDAFNATPKAASRREAILLRMEKRRALRKQRREHSLERREFKIALRKALKSATKYNSLKDESLWKIIQQLRKILRERGFVEPIA